MSEGALARWQDAALAAALLAIDPNGLGGAVLRCAPGPARDAWLTMLRGLLPPDAPWRRVPVQIADDRLLGGLDLAATLRVGRPVVARGLLCEADGGVAVLAMAERLPAAAAARIATVLDVGEVSVQRDGIAARHPTRFAVVALDEGIDVDECPPAALRDRLAFLLDLDGMRVDQQGVKPSVQDVTRARALRDAVETPAPLTRSLCAACMALGIESMRAPLLAGRAARAAAALAGRTTVIEDDVVLAARLVLAPRTTALPAAPPEEAPEQTESAEKRDREGAEDDALARHDGQIEDVVLAAAQAAIPAGLLLQLQASGPARGRGPGGRAGNVQRSTLRGRPIGSARGEPRTGARLSVIDTLRAAAPWQALRRRDTPHMRAKVAIRREDFRIRRFQQRTVTTTIFAVDASGSSALHRLAEAKGAVELLLAQCYVRRDNVALIAFRGAGAELVLPPTRSLVRARRSLAGLPGGGGTPLATGLECARALADSVRRRGDTPVIVLLTDGRANVARDGTHGRERAESDAIAAARRLHEAGFTSILVDTSPRAQAQAERLALEMGARYLPLPHADAARLSGALIQAAA